MSDFGKTFKLENLITHNRDKAELRVPTDDDLAGLGLLRPVQMTTRLKQVMEPWCLVTLVNLVAPDDHPDRSQALLLGRDDRGHGWCTSRVSGVDLEQGVVQTKNSFYGILGQRQTPDLQMCMHLAATFHGWGFGRMLGMPHVFY